MASAINNTSPLSSSLPVQVPTTAAHSAMPSQLEDDTEGTRNELEHAQQHGSAKPKLLLLLPFYLMVLCTLADLSLAMLARGIDPLPSAKNINWGRMVIQAIFYLSCVPIFLYSVFEGPRHWLPYLMVVILLSVAVGLNPDTQYIILVCSIAIVYGFKHADPTSLSFLPFTEPLVRNVLNVPIRRSYDPEAAIPMVAQPPQPMGDIISNNHCDHGRNGTTPPERTIPPQQ